MKYVFTTHAREQMMTRGITAPEAIQAIERGSKIRQTDGFLASYRYIQVAYKLRGSTAFVKTVMLR